MVFLTLSLYHLTVALGNLTYVHSLLEFSVLSFGNWSMCTATLIMRVVGSPKHRLIMETSVSKYPLPWDVRECSKMYISIDVTKSIYERPCCYIVRGWSFLTPGTRADYFFEKSQNISHPH